MNRCQQFTLDPDTLFVCHTCGHHKDAHCGADYSGACSCCACSAFTERFPFIGEVTAEDKPILDEWLRNIGRALKEAK